MPRINRLHYKNAFYHVMVRGNYQQDIFAFKQDYLKFCELLGKSTIKYDCSIHLFCLMTNHVHLVIEVGTIPLSKIMLALLSNYAKYFNLCRNKQGSLFQGRYKAKVISNNRYLKELIYYIHNNPLAAKIVSNVNDYPWSSHKCYMDEQHHTWLHKSKVTELLKKEYFSAAPYKEFMAKFKTELPIEDLDFKSDSTLSIENALEINLRTEAILNLSSYKLPELIAFICQTLNIPIEKINSISQMPTVCQARSIIAYFADYHANYALKTIAIYFERRADNISNTLHRHLADKKIQAKLKELTYVFQREMMEGD